MIPDLIENYESQFINFHIVLKYTSLHSTNFSSLFSPKENMFIEKLENWKKISFEKYHKNDAFLNFIILQKNFLIGVTCIKRTKVTLEAQSNKSGIILRSSCFTSLMSGILYCRKNAKMFCSGVILLNRNKNRDFGCEFINFKEITENWVLLPPND